MATPSAIVSRCSVDFTFPDFSELSWEPKIKAFSPVVELMGKRWRLILVPGGSTEGDKDYLSCFLQCLTEGTISMSYRLSVINQRQRSPDNNITFGEITHTFTMTSTCLDSSILSTGCNGLSKFLLRSTLLDRAAELLVNDTLIVRLELSPTPTKPCPIDFVAYNFLSLQNDEGTADLELRVAISDGEDAEVDTTNDVTNEQIFSVTLRAHKLVLSAFSEVFKTMFYGPIAMEEAHSNTLVIKDFSAQATQNMLGFCYTGNIGLEDYSDILELLALSVKYQMNALTCKCVLDLTGMLSGENAIAILDVANRLSLTKFKAAVMDFIADHQSSATRDANKLMTCDKDLLVEIIQNNALEDKPRNRV